VRSFYEKEEARKALEAALEYENELDDLNKRIHEHASKVGEVEAYVRNNKTLKEDAVKRRQIEAELKGLGLEFEKLEKVNKDWPVTESKISEISKQIPKLEENERKLDREKQEAESYQKGKELLDKYDRVKAKRQFWMEPRKPG